MENESFVTVKLKTQVEKHKDAKKSCKAQQERCNAQKAHQIKLLCCIINAQKAKQRKLQCTKDATKKDAMHERSLLIA